MGVDLQTQCFSFGTNELIVHSYYLILLKFKRILIIPLFKSSILYVKIVVIKTPLHQERFLWSEYRLYFM
jgi:hypothetical protein